TPLQHVMSNSMRWLFTEIERWTNDKIISPDQAAQLRALYPASAPGRSWGLILFSGLGAVVIGLGVILLLAYNWAEIPKFGKLALIFGSVVAAHSVGLWLRWKRSPNQELGEALSVLGTMSFGAGIWLVAQVYHINEHFPNGFLFWGLGALVLAWALVSVPQAILAIITLTIWSCSELFQFDSPTDWALPTILIGLAPLAWRKRSAVLAAVLLAAAYFILASHAGYWNGSGGAFTTAFSLSALLIATARLSGGDPSATRLVRVLAFFGWSGFIVCAYLLSFEDTVGGLLKWTSRQDSASAALVFVYRWPVFVLAVAAWSALLFRKVRAEDRRVALEEWLCPIALLYCQGLAVAGFYGDSVFVALVFNLVCLGIAVMWMVRGCREGRLRMTVRGSLFLSALVFARYFDLFDSLALRGVVFLLLGGVLFAEGFFYRRLRLHHADESEGAS
ncbi:MAG TPA: DUF2157 domain-containing protein, partial [Opitutus sp.]|nr:DUF2157 domain-containing protein [Opitutus sp.]